MSYLLEALEGVRDPRANFTRIDGNLDSNFKNTLWVVTSFLGVATRLDSSMRKEKVNQPKNPFPPSMETPDPPFMTPRKGPQNRWVWHPMTSQGFLGQKKLQKMVVFFFGDFHPMGFPSVKNHQIKTNPSFLEGKPVTSYGPRSKNPTGYGFHEILDV